MGSMSSGAFAGAVDYYTHNAVTIPELNAAPISLYHNEEPTNTTGTSPMKSRPGAKRSSSSTVRRRFSSRSYNATLAIPGRTCLNRSAAGPIRWLRHPADYIAMLERADQGIGRILDQTG
jgi:hypothetical protein